MRALTLWRPWPYAITHLGKRIENRGRRPPYAALGKYIALHAGLTLDGDAVEAIRALFGYEALPNEIVEEMPAGAIVAVACIDRCLSSREEAESYEQGQWWSGPLGWLLDDVRVLATPVPCRGNRGVWSLDAVTERAVIDQITEDVIRRDGMVFYG